MGRGISIKSLYIIGKTKLQLEVWRVIDQHVTFDSCLGLPRLPKEAHCLCRPRVAVRGEWRRQQLGWVALTARGDGQSAKSWVHGCMEVDGMAHGNVPNIKKVVVHHKCFGLLYLSLMRIQKARVGFLGVDKTWLWRRRAQNPKDSVFAHLRVQYNALHQCFGVLPSIHSIKVIQWHLGRLGLFFTTS